MHSISMTHLLSCLFLRKGDGNQGVSRKPTDKSPLSGADVLGRDPLPSWGIYLVRKPKLLQPALYYAWIGFNCNPSQSKNNA
jgi:hypothetical protein